MSTGSARSATSRSSCSNRGSGRCPRCGPRTAARSPGPRWAAAPCWSVIAGDPGCRAPTSAGSPTWRASARCCCSIRAGPAPRSVLPILTRTTSPTTRTTSRPCASTSGSTASTSSGIPTAASWRWRGPLGSPTASGAWCSRTPPHASRTRSARRARRSWPALPVSRGSAMRSRRWRRTRPAEYADDAELAALYEREAPFLMGAWGEEEQALGRSLAKAGANADALRHFNEVVAGAMDFRAGLARVQAPTLVITGTLDPFGESTATGDRRRAAERRAGAGSRRPALRVRRGATAARGRARCSTFSPRASWRAARPARRSPSCARRSAPGAAPRPAEACARRSRSGAHRCLA